LRVKHIEMLYVADWPSHTGNRLDA